MAKKRGQGEGSISKRPDGTWWARITLGKDENGKQKRKAFYGKTRKEVQEKLSAALDDYNKGIFINPARIQVSQWLKTWMQDYKKLTLKPSSYQDYHNDIEYYIKPYIGDISLVNLRPEMIQHMVAELVEKGLSASTIGRTVSVLKLALEQAVKNGLIYRNPAKDVTAPKRKKSARDVFTDAEQLLFVENIGKTSRYAPIYLLILSTGLRIGEALALTWDDVDFERRLLNVSKTIAAVKDPDDPKAKEKLIIGATKTEAGNRVIPLIPATLEMLSAIKEMQRKFEILEKGGGLIFRNLAGRAIRSGEITKDLKQQVAAMGIEKTITPHCLRHTFATRGLEKGIPLKVMQELLGHTSMRMTADLYTHVLDDTKKKSMMLLDGTVDYTSTLQANSELYGLNEARG